MPQTNKPFLASISIDQLTSWIESIGEKKFRSKQVFDWIYKKRTTNPEDMKNIPAGLRASLSEAFLCNSSSVVKRQAADDGTAKLLIELHDGNTVEAVVIPAEDGRRTFCLSTQVGCAVRCRFCASGADGLVRNMTAGEIIEQFYHACAEIGRLPDNIVIMGMGEGLHNYDNLVQALQLISTQDHIGLGARRITVSTSGIVKNIKRLADEGRQWNLALSLHAVNDEVRAQLIPDSSRFPLKDVLDACEYYRSVSKRKVTFEYILIKDVNDSITEAHKLTKLAAIHNAKVNLIPYNEVPTNDFERPEDPVIFAFKKVLDERNIPVTMRIEKGSKISAACGQLRAENKQ